MDLPKFGMLTDPTVDILKETRTIAKLGFDYVEIGIEGPEGKPEILLEKRNEILELLKKNNLFAIGHTSWWVELGTEYKPVRLGWLEEVKKIITVASKLNVKLVNLHSHSRGMYTRYDRNKKQILDNWVKSLIELVDYGKRYNAEIMFENAGEKGEITELKDFKYIVDRVPDLKVHLDIGHAFIFGKMKNVDKCIETFRNRIEHIHMHDNHGESDEHLPIGKGKINYGSVVKMLKKINYDKTITFEVFTSKKDAVRSREKIRKLWMKNNLNQ